MSYVDFGPSWFWRFILFVAILGLLAVIGAVGFSMWWLITHIKIV